MKNYLKVKGISALLFTAVFSINVGAQVLDLTTTYVGGNGQSGNMFDVTTLNQVVITGFDCNLAIGTQTIEIYYKTGTIVGFDTTLAAWTLIATTTATATAANAPTPLPVNLNLALQPGQTYGFYITSTAQGTMMNYTNGTAVGNVYVSDTNLQIKEGYGVAYPFAGTFQPRIWNGTIHYTAGPPQNYVVLLAPQTLNGNALPTSNVNYNLTAYNYGALSDSYNLSVSGNTFPTTFWLNGNQITNTGNISAGANLVFNVQVSVPAGTPIGFTDVATVTATSAGDPTVSDFSTVNTLSGDITPPGTASNVACNLNTNGTIDITWVNPTLNADGTVLTDLASINVLRSADNLNFTLLGNVTAPNQTFTDNSPLNGANYYTVAAVDLSGNVGAYATSSQCNVVANSGGPDAFGHVWFSSTGGTIPATFFNIATLGTALGVYGDDNQDALNLPWSFPFYTNSYTSCQVSTNGYITFGAVATPYWNQPIPTVGDPENCIFAFWDDLIVNQGTGEIYYYNDAANNRFVIQWNNVPRLAEQTNLNTFQMILYPNGKIDYNYQTLTSTSLTEATIGIEDSTATDGLQVAYNSPFLQSNLSVVITADAPPFITHTPLGNTTNVTNPYTVTAQIFDSGTVISADLFWRINSTGTYTQVPMTNTTGINYTAQIPAQTNGTYVEYYLVAIDDSSDVTTHPTNAPTNVHSFVISLTLPPDNLVATSNVDLAVPLTWQIPNVVAPQFKQNQNIFAYTSNGNVPFGFNNASGNVATKFFLAQNKGLETVEITFLEGVKTNYTVSLYGFGAGEKPGKLLGILGKGVTSGKNETIKFSLKEAVRLSNGKFFVVLTQEDENLVSLASEVQSEIPANTFFVSGKNTDNWQSFESLNLAFIPQIKILTKETSAFARFNGIAEKISNSPKADKLEKGKNIASYVVKNAQKINVKPISLNDFLKKALPNGKNNTNQIATLGLNSYKIYRSTLASNLIPPTATYQINQTTSPLIISYLDNDPVLANGTEYFYVVTSIFVDNVSGQIVESLPSNIASATPNDVLAPASPTGLTSTLNTGNGVDLTWVNPTTNADGTPLNDLASIKVYRGASAFGTPVLLTTLSSSNQTYTDGNPANGANFYFVTALDVEGNESALSASSQTNVVAASGGPDLYGHTWVSSLNGAVSFSFVDVSTNPASQNQNLTDDSFSQVTLPWAFPLYNDTFTTMFIGSNGYVNFDAGSSSLGGPGGLAFPNAQQPNGMISIFWDDLNPGSGGQVWYYADPNLPRVIIQWNQVPAFGGSVPMTMEIILWQDGTIEFQYLDIDENDATFCSVGIENLAATDGLQVINDDVFLQDQLAVWFTSEDNFPPSVVNLTNQNDTDIHNQNFPVWAKVTDTLSGVQADSVELFWKLASNTTWNNVPMTAAANDSFYAQIPAPNAFDVVIEYFISATDSDTGENTAYFPYNPTNGTGTPYSFEIRLIPPGTLNAESLVPNHIPLAWGQPGENGIEIKYDDGTSEFQSILPNSPPGINSPGPAIFISKFDIATQTQISGNAQLNSAKVFIDNGALPASTYKVKIYGWDTVTNVPGALLTELGPFTQTTSGSFVNFDFVNPVTGIGFAIGSGAFGIGVEQIGSDPISLGGDTSLNPPYVFNVNTHFIQGTGGNWAPIETLAPIYGQIIPMIRCFVEPLAVVAPVVNSPKAEIFGKKLSKGGNEINLNPSWNIVSYKLYKLNGAALNSEEVVTNGSVIFTGTTQNYDDFSVTNPNQYSYAATVVYDVNGTNLESHPGNLVVATPGIATGTPNIVANEVNFGVILVTQPSAANLVVKNTGTGILSISGMTFGTTNPLNAQFTNQPTFPLTVGVGDSVLVELTVFPMSIGNLTSTLEIANNTTATPNYVVNLIADVTDAIENGENEIPKAFSLEQNYPNPFNPNTKIKFGIPARAFVKLTIYNALGQVVKSLVNGNLEAAYHVFEWNGTDAKGRSVASGIYFARLEAGSFVKTQKMVLLK
ncbi:T9SS type A sorting domain-containing protein [bacterium]|nr:T9SS type A sorting domain-containing protein [bacterium]